MFVLFVIILLLRLDSLASESVFVIKFACANLALKTSAAKVRFRCLPEAYSEPCQISKMGRFAKIVNDF